MYYISYIIYKDICICTYIDMYMYVCACDISCNFFKTHITH